MWGWAGTNSLDAKSNYLVRWKMCGQSWGCLANRNPSATAKRNIGHELKLSSSVIHIWSTMRLRNTDFNSTLFCLITNLLLMWPSSRRPSAGGSVLINENQCRNILVVFESGSKQLISNLTTWLTAVYFAKPVQAPHEQPPVTKEVLQLCGNSFLLLL